MTQKCVRIVTTNTCVDVGFQFRPSNTTGSSRVKRDPSRFRGFFRDAVKRLDDGRIRIPMLHLNSARVDREKYGATRRYLQEHLIPSRRPAAEITDAHRDVAAALQECLDETLLHLCDHAGRATGLRRLVPSTHHDMVDEPA